MSGSFFAALIAAPFLAAAPVLIWDGPDLSDSEVAHAAVTANAIDVELARVALERTHDGEVKRFAEAMISAHTAVNEQAAALAQRLGVTPQDNEVSQFLRQDATQAREQLEKLSGTAFDRAYIEREVAYHQAVIDALDKVLIPSAKNTELKELLVSVRPALVAHLKMAEQIRDAQRRS